MDNIHIGGYIVREIPLTVITSNWLIKITIRGCMLPLIPPNKRGCIRISLLVVKARKRD